MTRTTSTPRFLATAITVLRVPRSTPTLAPLAGANLWETLASSTIGRDTGWTEVGQGHTQHTWRASDTWEALLTHDAHIA